MPQARTIFVIESYDESLRDRIAAIIPSERELAELSRTAFFEADVDSEAPLGYFCKQICEAFEATSETC